MRYKNRRNVKIESGIKAKKNWADIDNVKLLGPSMAQNMVNVLNFDWTADEANLNPYIYIDIAKQLSKINRKNRIRLRQKR